MSDTAMAQTSIKSVPAKGVVLTTLKNMNVLKRRCRSCTKCISTKVKKTTKETSCLQGKENKRAIMFYWRGGWEWHVGTGLLQPGPPPKVFFFGASMGSTETVVSADADMSWKGEENPSASWLDNSPIVCFVASSIRLVKNLTFNPQAN